MRSNISYFADWQAEDAMARLTEQAWQERRAEMLAEQRRMERERRRKVHWITNVVMIGAMCAVCFIAGMVVAL